MSAPDKEAVLERVLAAAVPAPRNRWLRPFLVAALVSLLAVVFWVGERGGPELVARGAGGPSLALSCAKTPCSIGTQLLFKPMAASQRYLSVVALAADGRAVWYFTGIDLESKATLTEGGVMSTAIELDVAHGPGAFEVVGVFTHAPVDKARVKAILETKDPNATIVRQALVVEP